MSKRFSWVARMMGAGAVVGMLFAAGIAYAQVPTFSSAGVTVGLGQSTTVTSQNGTSVYIYSNSSPTTASISVNGTQFTVTGEAVGTATLDLCAVGTASDCTNFTVVVQTASVSGISFSPSSLSLSVGANQAVTVSGGNGTYTVSSNTNTSVVSTNLSGSALAVSGLAAGGATIKVCDTAGTCGTLSVTINAASSNSSNSSGLSFSPSSVSLAMGTSQTIAVSGGNATYHVSNNSSSSVATASISSNGLFVVSAAAGNDTITVCDTSSACGTLTVAVTAPIANQFVVFSVTNPTLAVGQSMNVQISGGASNYFVIANQNPDVVQAAISNNFTLALNGLSSGTDVLTICAAGGSGCNPLTVTVGSGSAPAVTTTSTTTTTSATVTTSAPAVTTPTASVVANSALLAEIQVLQTAVSQALTVVQSVQTQLNLIEAQVSAGSGSGISTNTSAAVTTPASGTTYNFTELLSLGSQDAQVTELQQRLATLGFYSGPMTGYYGMLTQEAVTKYQTSHGIAATGYVGPSTRTALNAGN